MSTPSSSWVWDQNRGEYCYWFAPEQCFIYQSGTRVYRSHPQAAQPSIASQPQNVNPQAQPRFVPTTSTQNTQSTQGGSFPSNPSHHYEYANLTQAVASMALGSQSGGATQQTVPYSQTSSRSTQAWAYAPQSSAPLQPTPSAPAGYGQPAAPSSHENTSHVQGNIEEGPADVITDPHLFRQGVRASKKLNASAGAEELLDSRFRQRYPARDFFRVGKVFKCLWPEPQGNPSDGATFVTEVLGEKVLAKVRWFVVVWEGHNSATCLPIQTYGAKGVSKWGVVKNHHAVIYTGSYPPAPQQNEMPRRGELGMRESIRVNPTSRREKLDPLSRVNFGKVYTVEHFVKVYDFGSVDDSDIHRLIHQWKDVLGLGPFSTMSVAPHPTPYQQSTLTYGSQPAQPALPPTGYTQPSAFQGQSTQPLSQSNIHQYQAARSYPQHTAAAQWNQPLREEDDEDDDDGEEESSEEEAVGGDEEGEDEDDEDDDDEDDD